MAQCPSCRAVNPDSQSFCGTCGSRLSGSDGRPSPTLSIDVEGKLLKPGSLFAGKYQIEGEIGRGGMGIVFKAQDTHLRRAVALKFLPTELAARPEAKERFLREARAAASLDHSNICTIHEAEEVDGLAYIAMAFVEGQTLAAHIAEGPIPSGEALEIAIQAADGLAEAHRKGILHRDIKSSNIMLTGKGQAKIMDFGLAKMAGDSVLTKDSRTMGTVAYMSPEQARGEEVDQRTDIWSFGVVLYEMLAGRLPFRAEHEQAVIHAILHEDPKPIRKLQPELPEAFASVIAKTLTKDRDTRYASAEELLADLKRVKTGAAVAAPKRSLFAGRRKIAWAAAGLLVLIAGTLFLLTSKSSAKIYDSIAVLPFVLLGSDQGQDYFSDGLTDEVIKKLYKIAALNVKALAAVQPYKKNPKSIREMGRELGVKALVMSRMSRPTGRLHIAVDLVDASEETVLWTNTYDKREEEILILQSELTQDLVREVRVRVTADERVRLAKPERIISPKAHDNYLIAARLAVSEVYSKPALERLRALAKEALALEPDFLPIHSLLLDYYWNLWWFGFMPYRELVGPVKDSIANILRIDPESADAYYARSYECYFEYRWKDYLDAFSKAVELAPGDNSMRDRYSQALGTMGLTEKALSECRQIIANDPGFWDAISKAMRMSYIYIYGRRYDEAIAVCLENLKEYPKAISSWWNASLAYSLKGMHKEALEAIEKVFECHQAERLPIPLLLKMCKAQYLARAGDGNKALTIMHEIEGSGDRETLGTSFDVFMAMTLAGTGEPRDREEAFRYLELSTAEPNQGSNGYVGPEFDPIRSDPRFAQIVKKVGFPFQ